MKLSYLLCVATSLLTASCAKKEEPEVCLGSCTAVAGRLLTANGLQGIGRASIEVRWHYGQGSRLRSATKARATTDASGNYRVSFFIKDEELADGYFMVHYTVDKSKYYVIGDDGQVLNDARRDTLFQLPGYVIPRKAYVRLTVTNPAEVPQHAFLSDFNTCYGTNNTFSAQIRGGGPVVFWGNFPADHQLPVAGDQPILVRSSKTKNGVITRTTDSLFIAAGTTHRYVVTY